MRCGTSLRPHLMNLGVGRQPACVYLGTPLPQGKGAASGALTVMEEAPLADGPAIMALNGPMVLPKWLHPLPRGSCQSRIAGPEIRASHDVGSQNPRPATMLNHRPETATMLGHKIRGHPTQGGPGFTCHKPRPDRSRSSRLPGLSRAGCPTVPEPGAAATPGGRSSRPRTW